MTNEPDEQGRRGLGNAQDGSTARCSAGSAQRNFRNEPDEQGRRGLSNAQDGSTARCGAGSARRNFRNDIIIDLAPAGELTAEVVRGPDLVAETAFYQATSGGAAVYHQSFAEKEWQPYAALFSLTIPAASHLRGFQASVLEVAAAAGGDYSEAVSVGVRRYANGDLALFANVPFAGQVSII